MRSPPPSGPGSSAHSLGTNLSTSFSPDRELWWRQSSFKGKEITTEAQAEGAIEGSGDDYKVADFFSTDFKYRRFGVVEAAPRSVSVLGGAKRLARGNHWSVSKAGTSGDDVPAGR